MFLSCSDKSHIETQICPDMERVQGGSQLIAGCNLDVVRSNKYVNKTTSSEDLLSNLNGRI